MKCNSPVLTTVAVDISDWVLGSELVEMDSVLTVNALPVEDAVEDVDVKLSGVPVSTVEAPVVDSVDTGSVLSVVAVGLDVSDTVLPLEISVDVCGIMVAVVPVAVAVLPRELSLVSVGSEVMVTASVVPDCTLDDAVLVLCVSIDPVLVSILVGVVPSLATEAVLLVVSDEV